MAVANGNNRVLTKMLDRLLAALASGPSLNCRPHSSRQRMDWTQLGRLQDASPEEALKAVLGEDGQVKLVARAVMPRGVGEREDEEMTPEQRAARDAWEGQSSVLAKLRGIAEDARTYEQDTGVHVLNIGFPLLALPPGMVGGGRQRGPGRRVLAPIAFVPVNVLVKSGAGAGVVIACKGEGVDRVIPNTGLLAWIEQQTGKPEPDELFGDEEGADPWREICELVRHVCEALEIEVPEAFAKERHEGEGKAKDEGGRMKDELQGGNDGAGAGETDLKGGEDARGAHGGPCPPCPDTDSLLQGAPRAEETSDRPAIFRSAVLGLFPMANQGLLRDMQALAGGAEPLGGPIVSFVNANVNLDAPPAVEGAAPEPPAAPVAARRSRVFGDERLVAQADPCQARAVRLARKARALVIHGPPGTGKSQTITNIIGDHLARGQRVLLVSDKRTALDVVANRLNHMGLESLVALIHDPQRDQRELYRCIREQLEGLAEASTNERAVAQLEKVDAELQSLHRELTEYWQALLGPVDGAAFHDLVGLWLAIPETPESLRIEALGESIRLAELDQHAHLMQETLGRAVKVQWWDNPWRDAAGVELPAFVAVPMDKWRGAMARCSEAAVAVDGTLDATIPPFLPDIDLNQQAAARAELAERIGHALEHVSLEVRRRWAVKDEAAQSRTRKRLVEVDPLLQGLRSGGSLDAELLLTTREKLPTMPELALQIGALESYLEIAGKWYAFLQFKAKSAARPVMERYGLPLQATSAARLRSFLAGLRTRLVLQAIHYELYQVPAAIGLLSDEVLDRTLGEHRELLELIAHVRSTPALAPLLGQVIEALQDEAKARTLQQGLASSPARAKAIVEMEESLRASGLIDPKWLAQFDGSLRAGRPAGEVVGALAARVEDVEPILRIRAALAGLPAAISRAIVTLCGQRVEVEAASGAIRRVVLAATITRRLKTDPRLAKVDGQRIQSVFDRYRKLEEQKRDLVREAIVHQWVSRQKERLLAATGSRLNGLGAEVKRRLTLRGERAMRLRQVLAHGQATEGGDPLFDLCPVWMASPETVAQLFARKETFAVVIFDEASQCRLEETLPVLTRAARVVIAGDPKQLPPTRFFETALSVSEEEEIESDQQLFEAQQGEIEDLLGAALNIEIEEAYLDVHYRSRASELIEFSNEHFYSSRLQAIPGHPSNRPSSAPLMLHRVEGVYEKRRNEGEARAVCELVRDLLKRKDPPSIGIACFNLQQRDLIVEMLDEMAAEDDRFAGKLEAARSREGEGSFEGLFVKNLENVQGDERDVIIISTTYGPDASGRFYRRFGPLGKAGGGRRLNVLITRAREAVHLVSSIPAEVYRALPPVPQGQQPSGGWLLFAYLKYAEEVGAMYKEVAEADGQEAGATPKEGDGSVCGDASAAESSNDPGAEGRSGVPAVKKNATRSPSVFAEALAAHLVRTAGVGSEVYWGNEGFRIDVAVREGPEVTVGVLCDGSRFAGAEDPVEWDVFATTIHESQGWTLSRVWSPQFFRDPKGVTRAILAAKAKT